MNGRRSKGESAVKLFFLFAFGALLFAALSTMGCSSTPAPAPPAVVTVIYPTQVSPTQPPTPTADNRPPPAAPTQPPAPTPVAQRITFAQGQFNTTVNGVLSKNGMANWILRIVGGQTLSANLVPANGKAKKRPAHAR